MNCDICGVFISVASPLIFWFLPEDRPSQSFQAPDFFQPACQVVSKASHTSSQSANHPDRQSSKKSNPYLLSFHPNWILTHTLSKESHYLSHSGWIPLMVDGGSIQDREFSMKLFNGTVGMDGYYPLKTRELLLVRICNARIRYSCSRVLRLTVD